MTGTTPPPAPQNAATGSGQTANSQMIPPPAPVVAAGTGTPQTPSTPPALKPDPALVAAQAEAAALRAELAEMRAALTAKAAEVTAPTGLVGKLGLELEKVQTAVRRSVRFNHNVHGATFIESPSQGVHYTHTFVGGFLEVDPEKSPSLFEQLMDIASHRGSGITVEDQAFEPDPAIRQASQDVLQNAVRSMEKITGKTLGTIRNPQ